MFDPKLGLSLITLAEEPTESVLRAVAASTITTLELDARMFEDPAGRPSRVSLVNRWTGGGDLTVKSVHALFGAEYDLSSPAADIRGGAVEAVRDALWLASSLGARIIVVHPSTEPIAAEDRPRRMRYAAEALEELEGGCRETGVKIAVELLPRTCLGNTVEELLELISGRDRNLFGVCLDTNHLMDRPETLAAVVRELGEDLTTLHISDYDGVDEKHLLPGKGVLDWAEFMRALAGIGYTGPFDYESKIDGETIDDRIAGLEENFAWMRSLGGRS